MGNLVIRWIFKVFQIKMFKYFGKLYLKEIGYRFRFSIKQLFFYVRYGEIEYSFFRAEYGYVLWFYDIMVVIV